MTPTPASADAAATSEATDRGRAQEFLAPELLEDLSVRLWDLEDETQTNESWYLPRRSVALHAFSGLGHGVGRSKEIGRHLLVGGAVSLRLSWSRYARKPKLVAQRFAWLEGQHATRLRQVLGQECTRTKQAVSDYALKLEQTQRLLRSMGEQPKPSVPEPELPTNQRPYAKACTGNVSKPPPSSAPSATATEVPSEQVPDARQVAFLREVEDDLIARLATARADLSFIISTDINSRETIERARNVVTESQRFFRPHVEGLLGYTFQVSEGGLAEDLGGVTGAIGGGIAPVSAGVFFSQPRVIGFYVSLSAEVIN